MSDKIPLNEWSVIDLKKLDQALCNSLSIFYDYHIEKIVWVVREAIAEAEKRENN